jgi:dGTPase
MSAMNWKKLLSSKRLGKTEADAISLGRSPFQQDFDRIVFSSAFRRLQDKAQVFPLAENDYVRTRLTHSMEVSCIGRSLGTRSGVFICKNNDVGLIQPSDVGAIIAAACLAHDIGNPPLGHSGEEAIRHWFCHSAVAAVVKKQMSRCERADFERYEGNAQGFRVLTRLQMPDNYGGMQLTCATLGAFSKYPTESCVKKRTQGVAMKKFNFFQADKALFLEVAETTGLLPVGSGACSWCRHPLAFLVEAADDISYRIIDFEDSHFLGAIDYNEVESLFMRIIDDSELRKQLKNIKDCERRVEIMRARAIGKLVHQISDSFEKHHDEIIQGTLTQPLIELIPAADALKKIELRSFEDVYTYRRAVEIEAAGFELTEGLLDAFMTSVNDVAQSIEHGTKPLYRNSRLMLLIPGRYRNTDDKAWRESAYVRLLNILDYVSDMTDSYAVSLFKKIKGISLPGQYS